MGGRTAGSVSVCHVELTAATHLCAQAAAGADAAGPDAGLFQPFRLSISVPLPPTFAHAAGGADAAGPDAGRGNAAAAVGAPGGVEDGEGANTEGREDCERLLDQVRADIPVLETITVVCRGSCGIPWTLSWLTYLPRGAAQRAGA